MFRSDPRTTQHSNNETTSRLISRGFGLSLTAVSQSVQRGEQLAEQEGYQLLAGLEIKPPENQPARAAV